MDFKRKPFKASIDCLRLYHEKDHNLFYLNGWMAGDHLFEDVHLFLNGQEVDMELKELERKDVAANPALNKLFENSQLLNSGFDIIARFKPEPLKSMKLTAGGHEIFNLDKKQLVKILSDSPLSVRILSVFKNHVEGIVTPAEEADLSFKVHDKKPDVSFANFKIQQEPFNGPEVMTPWKFSFDLLDEPSKKADLIIRQGSHQAVVPLKDPNDHSLEEMVRHPGKAVEVLTGPQARSLVKSAAAAGVQVAKNPSGTFNNALHLYRMGGIPALKGQLRRRLGLPGIEDDYDSWIKTHRTDKKDLEKQRKTSFDYEPLISIVLAAYNPAEEYFRDMVMSIVDQTYPRWELCIADGSSTDTVENVVASINDPRIKLKKLKENMGISKNTNAAADMAEGDWIAFGDHDDFLEPDTLFEVVKAINEKNPDMVYTDEDKFMSVTKKFDFPNLKPDYSPYLLMATNYICHFTAMKRPLFESLGRLNPEYDGAQDYDLVLRASEVLDPEKIVHIPRPLYHWRAHLESTSFSAGAKNWAFDAGMKALQAHLDRMNIHGTAREASEYNPGIYTIDYKTAQDQGYPLVSILIPNKDHSEDLIQCVESLASQDYPNMEILVIENNSTEDETFKVYHELEKKYPNLRLVYYPEEFNYSKINNFGRAHAKGDLLLLLNNDTKAMDDQLISVMANLALQPNMGAVGAKLYYPDGTFQHDGVVMGVGGIAGHAFLGKSDIYPDYKILSTRDLSAVTAACLMTPAVVYDEVGGLEEQLKVAFNDVDYCMKVREKGYDIVLDPKAKMYHFESKSRGLEDTKEKQERFMGECRYITERWLDILENGDPFYNPNYSILNADYSLKWADEKNPFVEDLYYRRSLENGQK